MEARPFTIPESNLIKQLWRLQQPQLIRQVVLAILILIAAVQPLPGRSGLPGWFLLLLFAGYTLLADRLVMSPGRRVLLDLAAAGVIYGLSSAPGGPAFGLMLLVVCSAAATLRLHKALLTTGLAMLLVVLVAPTLPLWEDSLRYTRELSIQLLLLALAGSGVALFTHRVRREQAEAEQSRGEAEQLAELNRLRSDFLATISHDLRTPLTAASAGLGLLASSSADRLRPDERRLLENARRNIARLERHIADLLALNQLTAGSPQLAVEPLDMRDVVKSARAAVLPLFLEKDQICVVDMPVPLPLRGDPWRLEQMVVNLLYNAHQHTPSGTQVSVSGGLADGEVRLTVADSGPGIAAGLDIQIFNRFVRGEGGGSGLGLTIVQGIATLHGGRVWLEQGAEAPTVAGPYEAPRRGACFHIALPACTLEELT